MKCWIFFAAVSLLPASAYADTKNLECKLTTDKGVEQMIYAKIDDTSDKAEVELFAVSAACATNRSCGTRVYVKDVLPSVIRLTSATHAGGSVALTTVVDIDRTTLAVDTRSKLETSAGRSETTARGQCSVTVDSSKKLL